MNKYKQVPKEKKEKSTSFLTPSKKYIMIEKCQDELKSLKNILNEIPEQEINEVKNDTKRKLNMKFSDKLDVD